MFSNPATYIIECISWAIKYLIFLRHGATMKIVIFPSKFFSEYFFHAQMCAADMKDFVFGEVLLIF